MLPFSFYICADLPQLDILSHPIQAQALLIERSFEHVDMQVFRDFHGGNPVGNICQWTDTQTFHVVCVNGILHKLSFAMYHSMGNVNLGFLPHSITHIKIVFCDQEQEFSTRSLPKNAEKVDLSHNKLYGTPDLAALPTKLTHLFLHSNRLTGPINLCFLPKSLTYLQLQHNKIEQDVLLFGNISKHMNQITLSPGTIGGLYAIPGTGKWKKNLFGEFRKSKIHTEYIIK